MARVRLDASRVSQVCNCQERESDQVYKSSQRTFWGTHVQIILFTLASSRADCEREHCMVPWDFLSVLALSIWWFGHWLGCWSAIGRSGAALFFCRFLRWILKKDGGSKRCTSRSFDEAGSNVLVNRQDQLSNSRVYVDSWELRRLINL